MIGTNNDLQEGYNWVLCRLLAVNQLAVEA